MNTLAIDWRITSARGPFHQYSDYRITRLQHNLRLLSRSLKQERQRFLTVKFQDYVSHKNLMIDSLGPGKQPDTPSWQIYRFSINLYLAKKMFW